MYTRAYYRGIQAATGEMLTFYRSTNLIELYQRVSTLVKVYRDELGAALL